MPQRTPHYAGVHNIVMYLMKTELLGTDKTPDFIRDEVENNLLTWTYGLTNANLQLLLNYASEEDDQGYRWFTFANMSVKTMRDMMLLLARCMCERDVKLEKEHTAAKVAHNITFRDELLQSRMMTKAEEEYVSEALLNLDKGIVYLHNLSGNYISTHDFVHMDRHLRKALASVLPQKHGDVCKRVWSETIVGECPETVLQQVQAMQPAVIEAMVRVDRPLAERVCNLSTKHVAAGNVSYLKQELFDTSYSWL